MSNCLKAVRHAASPTCGRVGVGRYDGGAVDRVQLLLKLSPASACVLFRWPTVEEENVLAAMFATAKAADVDGCMTRHEAAAPQMLLEIKAVIDHEPAKRPELAACSTWCPRGT